MTRFDHQKRSGRSRKGKAREPRRSLQIRTPEQLVAHRELAYLRNPSPERLAKLEEARRRL